MNQIIRLAYAPPACRQRRSTQNALSMVIHDVHHLDDVVRRRAIQAARGFVQKRQRLSHDQLLPHACPPLLASGKSTLEDRSHDVVSHLAQT